MIKLFLMNLLLSFIWVALRGSLSYSDFLFGYLLGFGMLWIMNRNESDRRYFYRVPKIVSFFFFFLYELIKANIQVAFDVITPKYFFKPGIVRYPVSPRTDFEVNILSTFISLTPGTLIIDVSDDKQAIYIHVMYLRSEQEFIDNIKTGVEKRLFEILR